jgi:hypothetical protein
MKCRSCWFFLSLIHLLPIPSTAKVIGYQGFSPNFQVGKTTAG